MSKRHKRAALKRRTVRNRRPETLESREVMSADPFLGGGLGISHHAIQEEAPPLMQHDAPMLGGGLGGFIEDQPGGHDPNADFWTSTSTLLSDDFGQRIEQTLADAHDQTGQDHVVSKYGFTGAGQTVAVIDSGIAYNHYALGGGLGSGYRVVGGYDFTENDADPNDDGPEGGHGSHVAGIVGASDPDGAHSGVATEVDLVGLRVFDDAGNGYFSWVEQSLDWVIANQYAFDNPITAINLSLGIEWNSDSIPSWAMLEDEFAAIEAAGIFISVSAGNSFTSYNEAGLSYPAGSDHVVPVMSTDNDGDLSYFSQRSTEAIAAPGRWITSTVPDYVGNDGDTIDDDWVSMSGTSMAAPYVAGASVLVREAMEFVGMTDIDQWDIYNHMMATADTFYDSATDANYKRLNLEAAIDALMPIDDFGSNLEEAHNLGTLNAAGVQSQSIVSGVITTLDDADFFTFTAGSTGTVTFTASSVSHNLATDWSGWGGEWTITQDGSYAVDVVAGQQYTVSIGTDDGLGYYDLAVNVESTMTYTDWGTLSTQQTESASILGGESWFRVEAAKSGFLTAELLDSTALVQLYDANQNLMAEVAQGGGDQRFDTLVTAGSEYFIRVSGGDSSVDVRLTNALEVSGAGLLLTGTAGNDTFIFDGSGSGVVATLNGAAYDLTTTGQLELAYDSGGGSDVVRVYAGAGDETATLRQGDLTVDSSDGWTVTSAGHRNAEVHAGAGNDMATLYDTAANDKYVGWEDRAVLFADTYFNDARGFEVTTAHSTAGGSDSAVFYDSAGDDRYLGWSDRAVMFGDGYFNDTRGFVLTTAYATAGGNDTTTFYDSAGNDKYVGWSDRSVMFGSGYFNDARGFEVVTAEATAGGSDLATFYDSAENDKYIAWSDRAVMFSDGYFNETKGFDVTSASSTAGGFDTATFYDSAGNDKYVGWSHRAVMFGSGYFNDAWGFDVTTAHATAGGSDLASLYDTPGNDRYVGWHDRVVLFGEGYFNDARGFDVAITNANAGGYDTAEFYDSAAADRYVAWSNRAAMFGNGYFNDTWGFDKTTAYSTSGGGDSADLYGSATDDAFVGVGSLATLTGDGYENTASGFGSIRAIDDSTGNDTTSVSAVDYAFEQIGDWS